MNKVKKIASIKEYTKINGEKHFMLKVYLGANPSTGYKHYIYRRGYKTKEQAEQALVKLKIKLAINKLKTI